MMKVSKAKLEAYEKALHAENNCVMLYMVGNRKQFDVYGTYYVKRKVNCARGVKVYKDVKTVGWHKVSQKDVAEILKNYGLTVDEFVAIANGEYEEETAEVENVTTNEEVTAEVKEETEMQEVKVQEASATTEIKKFEVGKIYFPCVRFEKPRIKITKRTAKTVHYKIERFNDEFDCETRANISIFDGSEHFYSEYLNRSYYALDEEDTAVETENTVNAEDSSTVKAAKEELIYVNNQIKGVQRDIEYYVEQIKEYIGCIAKCENFISNYGVNLYDLQNKAAALENEIANRKIVDAIDDIGGSADAVDASVAAMIELNAANFTTANLLDAVNAQVGTAVENIPVKFEIQNFAADAVTANDVATIDTAVSGTVIEPADEDDVKTQAYLAEIADIDAQIAALQAKRAEKETELLNLLEGVTAWAYDKIKAVTSLDSRYLEIIAPARSTIFRNDFDELYFDCFKDGGFQISKYLHRLVTYSTAKQFKAVIRDLVAAIERGDKTFAFPADIPPIAEVADSDTETQKAI